MKRRIEPRPLSGRTDRIPSSKSQAHRLLIAAFLSGEETAVEGFMFSRDVEATCGCLRALGADVRRTEKGLLLLPGPRPDGEAELDCEESGSTLRFMLPVAAALGADAAFTGRGKLPERPLSPLYEELEAHGVRLSPQGKMPLRIRGQLAPGRYEMAGNVSSQFFTGLLLALPRLPGDSEIRILGALESEPYVRMTTDALELFGVRAERTEHGFRIPGGQRFRSPGAIRAEGDWSGAAFLLAAGALDGRGVTLDGMNPASSQGDRAILPLLRAFGAEAEETRDRVTIRGGNLRGIDLDAAQIPDLVPVLAAVAACARGDTRIRSVSRLRLKESDRIASVLAMVRSLGGSAEASENEMVIHGQGGLRGGEVNAFGDHRIAMAAAVAAVRASGTVTVDGAECVAKSFPDFWEVYESLGGKTDAV